MLYSNIVIHFIIIFSLLVEDYFLQSLGYLWSRLEYNFNSSLLMIMSFISLLFAMAMTPCRGLNIIS